MKSMRPVTPVLVQGGNAEEQINKVTDQVIAARLKGDANSYEKLLADDYTAIRGDGKLTTKAQEIENFKSGATKDESLDVRDQKIRVYGDTAVVTALFSFKGTVNGKPVSGDFRTTRVWVKQDGNWKLVAFQGTRVTPASQ